MTFAATLRLSKLPFVGALFARYEQALGFAPEVERRPLPALPQMCAAPSAGGSDLVDEMLQAARSMPVKTTNDLLLSGRLEEYARARFEKENPELFEYVWDDIARPVEVYGRLVTRGPDGMPEMSTELAAGYLDKQNLASIVNVLAERRMVRLSRYANGEEGEATLRPETATRRARALVLTDSESRLLALALACTGAVVVAPLLLALKSIFNVGVIELAVSLSCGAPVFWMTTKKAWKEISRLYWVRSETICKEMPAIIERTTITVDIGKVRAAVQRLIDDPVLSLETKQTVVGYARCAAEIEGAQKAYQNQIRTAQSFSMKLLPFEWAAELGIGSGRLWARGEPLAYGPGQAIRMHLDSFFTGTIVLGATGSKKTRSIILPLMYQCAELGKRLHEWPEPTLRAGMFVCGGKRSEVNDARKVAAKLGVPFRVIGLGPRDYSFDLIGDLPSVAAYEIFDEAIDSANNGKVGNSDPIWRNTPRFIAYQIIVLSRVWAQTPGGLAYALEKGTKVYAPGTWFDLSQNITATGTGSLMYRAVNDILTAYQDLKNNPHMAALMTQEVLAAIGYLRSGLREVPTNQLGSFLTQLRDDLKGFVSTDEIRERFGMAGGEPLDVNRIFEGNVITALDMSAAGPFGKCLTAMITTRAFYHAEAECLLDPQINEKRVVFWFADELQDIALKGGRYSVAGTLPNRIRQIGICMVVASQSIPGLYVGLDQSTSSEVINNILSNFQNRVVLSTKDEKTLKLVESLTNRVPRSTVIELDQYESRCAHLSMKNRLHEVMGLSPKSVQEATQAALAVRASGARVERIKVDMRKDIRIDDRFLNPEFTGGTSKTEQTGSSESTTTGTSTSKTKGNSSNWPSLTSTSSASNSNTEGSSTSVSKGTSTSTSMTTQDPVVDHSLRKQTIEWRAIDKRDALMSSPLEWSKSFVESDLSNAAHGIAFFDINAAGAHKCDIGFTDTVYTRMKLDDGFEQFEELAGSVGDQLSIADEMAKQAEIARDLFKTGKGSQEEMCASRM